MKLQMQVGVSLDVESGDNFLVRLWQILIFMFV